MLSGGLKSQFVCEPVYNFLGRLMAIEVLTKFISARGETLSYTHAQLFLTAEDKWENFQRQLRTVLLWKDYCLQHEIIVSLNVDEQIVERLMASFACLNILSKCPFINLEVSEHFPNYDKSDHESPLCRLLPFTQLWLDDVGSGCKNNFNFLTKGLFKAAKIDKAFFWKHQSDEQSDRLGKTIRDLSRYAGVVVIEGVETLEHLRMLAPFSHCWLQGFLFQSVNLEHFKTLPLYIDPLGY